jgi:hypothetical protein
MADDGDALNAPAPEDAAPPASPPPPPKTTKLSKKTVPVAAAYWYNYLGPFGHLYKMVPVDAKRVRDPEQWRVTYRVAPDTHMLCGVCAGAWVVIFRYPPPSC